MEESTGRENVDVPVGKESPIVQGMELRVRSLEEINVPVAAGDADSKPPPPVVAVHPSPAEEIRAGTTTSTKEKEYAEDEETKILNKRKRGEETSGKQEGRRYKKRKVAIFVSYCGYGYQGMQKNIGAKTIEGDLEEALFKAGAIAESTYGDPRKVDWARAARTDKGVSAVGQIVSGRFFIDPPGLVDRVNHHLAEQIRVLGFKRVTGGFNAKKLCDRRKYEYVVPLFCLDPASHPCKVAVYSRKDAADSTEAATEAKPDHPQEPFSCPCEEHAFKFGDEERSKLNRILGYFVGTHNFHNYTCRIKPEDPSTQRYILSFEAGDVFAIDGQEFVRCTVVGQSFMLHQIRKMIGHAVAVMRGAPEYLIATAFRRDVKLNVPMAPELGLFLDECMYTAYNQRYADSHEEISLKDFAKENAEFKNGKIYPHIASTDSRDRVYARWLHSLTEDKYADLFKEQEQQQS